MTCYIESESGVEEMWGGLDVDKRLIEISPVFYGHIDLPESGVPAPPVVNSIDGDGKPVLPLLDIGFKKLGPEGGEAPAPHLRLAPVAEGETREGPRSFSVEYRVNPAPIRTDFIVAGTLPERAAVHALTRLNVGAGATASRSCVRQVAAHLPHAPLRRASG